MGWGGSSKGYESGAIGVKGSIGKVSSGGKSYGGKGSYGSYGSYGGKGGQSIRVQDPSKTLWIGNVPQNTTYQELLEHAKLVSAPKWAEVRGSTAAIGYPSAEDAAAAIAELNGSAFNGHELQADHWKGKPSAATSSYGKSWGKGGGIYIPASEAWKYPFLKSLLSMGGKGWGGKGWGGKNRSKIQYPEKTTWIGNLPKGTHFRELLDLAKVFGDAKWAEVWGTTGAVGWASEEAAHAGAAKLNGQKLGGEIVLADMWGKKDSAES